MREPRKELFTKWVYQYNHDGPNGLLLQGRGGRRFGLLAMIAGIDSRSIQLDLEALIDKPNFVNNMGRNMKTILEREISERL